MLIQHVVRSRAQDTSTISHVGMVLLGHIASDIAELLDDLVQASLELTCRI